ncbi:MAG: cytochrome c oxidase subunit I, partial [Dolichospermum sp.]
MTQAQLQETDHNHNHTQEHKERHWRDFFGFSTDHKVIGIQYLVTSFIFYCIGGVMADLVRTEL